MNKMEYILTESITKPKNYYNYATQDRRNIRAQR